jgi:hypothetical protein
MIEHVIADEGFMYIMKRPTTIVWLAFATISAFSVAAYE